MYLGLAWTGGTGAVHARRPRRMPAPITMISTYGEGKARYDRWYAGHQVVVAEIRTAYGDGRLAHLMAPLATMRRPADCVSRVADTLAEPHAGPGKD